jgi:hypothetical protein
MFSSLAGDVSISVPTAKRWLSVLKTSGIICLANDLLQLSEKGI